MPDAGEAEHPLVEGYRRRLQDLDAADTADGLHVLHLVAMLAAGKHTAAGAASLSREVAARLDAVTQGRRQTADRIDELQRRRRTRASGR